VAFLYHKTLKITRLILHQIQRASHPCSHYFTAPFPVTRKEKEFIIQAGCGKHIPFKNKNIKNQRLQLAAPENESRFWSKESKRGGKTYM